jgi:hypothetical protein
MYVYFTKQHSLSTRKIQYDIQTILYWTIRSYPLPTSPKISRQCAPFRQVDTGADARLSVLIHTPLAHWLAYLSKAICCQTIAGVGIVQRAYIALQTSHGGGQRDVDGTWRPAPQAQTISVGAALHRWVQLLCLPVYVGVGASRSADANPHRRHVYTGLGKRKRHSRSSPCVNARSWLASCARRHSCMLPGCDA